MLSLLIASAAAWMISRDRAAALRTAGLHLDNFAVVLAEHTRLGLQRFGAGTGKIVGPDAPDATVQRYFGSVFAELEHRYEGRVLLMRRDGTLIATFPAAPESLGRSFAGHPLFTEALRSGEHGAVEAHGILEAKPRLIGFRAVKDQPLVVAISAPLPEVLEEWNREVAVVATAALVLIAITIAAAALLGRQLRITGELGREVAESEMRLTSIIDSAMDAVIAVDEDQKIVLFNTAAERTFECKAQDAIGSPLDRFIPPRYRAMHREHVKRFGEAGATVRRMGAELVLSGLRAGGEEFPIDASISQTTIGGRKYYTVILRDVTERVRALEAERRSRQELAENEERLESILNSAMDAIITIDEAQEVVLFNRAAERIFRCPAAQAIGTSIERFIPERFRASHYGHVRRFGEAGASVRRMGGELVLAGLRDDGEEFPIDASISHVTVGGRKFYTVILRDITERQRSAEALNQSHRELRELYEAMHEVREAERTRIARELHDELAQWLTALKMDASWIAARLPRENEQLVAKAERMKSVVDETVAAIRRIAADLRPVMLDDLGLFPAIENLLNELSQRAGIVVSLSGNAEEIHFKEPLATAVYRMVQEALTNVARHAGATSVEVELDVQNGVLQVCVRDNGRGLQPDPDRKSFGVLGIKERARTLGGEARIYSPERGGTIVDIRVPMESHRIAEASA